jgi:hypothetical protein
VSEGPIFLSTLPAQRRDRRYAAIGRRRFGGSLPRRGTVRQAAAAPVWAFIPIYESALVVNDLTTAILLFGQFSFLRSRALLLLATGYCSTAFIAIAHALTFPRAVRRRPGSSARDRRAPAWLYMFWHGGFPLFVIAYALVDDDAGEGGRMRRTGARSRLASASAFVAASALTLLATSGQLGCPDHAGQPLYAGDARHRGQRLGAEHRRAWRALGCARRHSVLDLWLMVVMCAWIFDIALSAVFNAGRFDLGFYAGRIYGC